MAPGRVHHADVPLADATARLLSDHAERDRLGANGRRAVEAYRASRVVPRIEAVYSAVSTAAGSSPAGSSSGATKKGTRVTVHVAGAVAKPGVYDLAGGARVIDAIEAAGGGAPDADLNRLNLAAKVADGQRVLVQRVG